MKVMGQATISEATGLEEENKVTFFVCLYVYLLI